MKRTFWQRLGDIPVNPVWWPWINPLYHRMNRVYHTVMRLF